jgi:two-component system chemotaxis response regulator CheY
MSEKELTDIRVILVEPSRTQQHIIQQFLNDLGILNITCLRNGSETLEQVENSAQDLIISSMYLPDMTGADLVHKLRQKPNSYDMTFLLISSETNIQYLEPIRQAGAIAILPKPFTSSELDIALNATLDYLNPQQIELDLLDIEDISLLVVDDSPTSLNYLCKILNDIGINKITRATNGKEAFELINDQYYDLIVTDFNMPEMDGLQLTTSIREESNQKTIPILMVTSEKNESRLAAVQQAGVFAVMDKPFKPATIRQFITQAIN